MHIRKVWNKTKEITDKLTKTSLPKLCKLVVLAKKNLKKMLKGRNKDFTEFYGRNSVSFFYFCKIRFFCLISVVEGGLFDIHVYINHDTLTFLSL